jgi:hypothetical protein
MKDIIQNGAARKAEPEPQQICGWCLESGPGNLIHVYEVLILDSHPECKSAAEQYMTPCTCLKYQGDNSFCPKHGKQKCSSY